VKAPGRRSSCSCICLSASDLQRLWSIFELSNDDLCAHFDVRGVEQIECDVLMKEMCEEGECGAGEGSAGWVARWRLTRHTSTRLVQVNHARLVRILRARMQLKLVVLVNPIRRQATSVNEGNELL